MLISVEANQLSLGSNLLAVNPENNQERVYIWQRRINPIDLKSIRKQLIHNSCEQIKTYFYDNQISYAAVTNDKIELYRDLFGLSNIYYSSQTKECSFSETLKDFYGAGINHNAIEQYKRIGYVPADSSIINGVKKVFPGEKITVHRRSGGLKSRRERLTNFLHSSFGYSSETFKEQFESILLKDVDSAEGLLLSGGLDSGLLAYSLNKKNKRTVAFTGYTKDRRNQVEKERAIRTADLFCKDHQLVELNGRKFEKYYLQVFKCMDEPFFDNAILGTSILAIHASQQGIKVLADGCTGDELWGHAKSVKRYLYIRKVSGCEFLRKMFLLLPWKLNRLGLGHEQLIKYYSARDFTDEEFDNIVLIDYENLYFEEPNLIGLATFMTLNIGGEMAKIKLASSASGCSFILPFATVDAWWLALGVPAKVKFERDKAILKDLYEVELGREKYEDAKMGFYVPTARWVIDNHRDSLYSGPFYKESLVNELVDTFESKPATTFDQEIWRIFVLNKWYEINKNSLS